MSKRINVTFTDEDYETIKNIADKQNRSTSDVVREFAIEGFKGKLGVENIDLITRILREQLKVIINPSVERICALSAKTCVMSATAAYLNAETVARFVPDNVQLEVKEAYDLARMKAIKYTKSKISDD